MTIDRPTDRLPIDAARVRGLFGRPRVLDADDFVAREVSRRMSDRLTTIRLDATRIVDLGCGAGGDAAALSARFPEATLVALDVAMPPLQRIGAAPPTLLGRLLRRPTGPLRLQADFGALPLAARSVDLLWSNLALHWSSQPHVALTEWSRVATVGGLVAFSAFGPDTLREVADVFGAVDSARHVMPFTDMHDYGDMLVAAGFATPVVDMERLTLTYSTPASLWRDVRALGGNGLLARARGLHGRAWGACVADALETTRDATGSYQLTFELIFAHAWKGEPRTTSAGETIVRVQRAR